MVAILRLLLYLAEFAIAAFGVWAVLPDKTKAQLTNWVKTWILAALSGATTLLAEAEPLLQPIVAAFVSAFNRFGGPIASEIRAPIAAVARTVLSTSAAGLTSSGESTPDNALQMAADAMADAFGFGISSAGVAAAFESAFPEKLNVLNGVAPMLAKMAGFDEVAAAVRDPLYENAFGKSLEYHFRSVFKPDLPSEFDAVRWHSQRLLTDAQLRTLFGFSGLKAEYEEPFITSAYRAVQPRAIATAVQDTPFPRDQMQSLLEFGGYRPQDVPLMLDLFELASTRNVRNQYLSAITTAAERGTLTPAEVDSSLTDLNFSPTAKNWVALTIATRKLQQLAELYRKSISEAYHYSLITDAQYVPALEAIGIAAADANAHYAVDSEKKLGQQAAADARALAIAAAEVTRAASKAALLNYQEGNIDAVALTAALAVAGVPASVIPFAVDVAVLRKQASMRSVFGKQVDQKESVVLREQVAALKEQVIKKLLDVQPAYDHLVALGIPATNAQDLVAVWAAQALKTVIPVL